MSRKLTDEQARAGSAPEPWQVVVAGAGTGKTTVIEARYAHLVESEHIRPQQIMLLTFARKAAAEMRARVTPIAQRADLSYNPDILPIGTFHSIALREVRLDPSGFGLPSTFVVIDEDDAADLWAESAEKLGGRTLPEPQGDLRRAYGYYRNAGVRYEDHMRAAYGRAGDPAIALAEEYRLKKREAGYLDYDDLLTLFEARLRSDRDWKEDFRARTRAVVVDEYQDCSPLQEKILMGVAPEYLTVVGDPNQSIYAWRGSSPDLIRQKMRDPRYGRYPLSLNFRCAVEHLQLANRLASDGVCLTSGTGKHGKLAMPVYRSFDEEIDAIAEAMARCEEAGDLAVLARSKAPLQRIEERALALGVKRYRMRGALSMRDRAEAKDFLAYFRVGLNPADFLAARRVFALYPGIGPKTAASLASSIRSGGALPAEVGHLSFLFGKLADESLAMSVRAKLLREEYAKCLARKWEKDPEQLKRRMRILDGIAGSASGARNARSWIDVAVLDRDAPQGNLAGEDHKPTIELATIHAYKGAEKPKVWLMGANEGRFPLRNQPLDEEKRLAYVGATRSLEHLVISSSKEHRRSRFFTTDGIGK